MKNFIIPVIICIAIVASIFMFNNENTTKKYTTGKIIVHDSVVVHDTLYKKVAYDKIGVSKEISKIDDKTDSNVCYSFKDTLSDSTIFDSKICSKDLPASKPIDLSWSFTYKPKKDTIRTFTKIDTMTIIKKPKIKPVYYVIAGAIAGAVVVGIIKR